MATFVDAAMSRLSADATFMASLPGGIYSHTISREGRGKTPQAFDTGLWLKPSVVVESGDESPGDRNMPGAYRDQITLAFYAPSDAQRKAMIVQAYERAIRLLKLAQPDNPADNTPWWYVNDDGRRMFPDQPTSHSATRIYDSEIFKGNSEKRVTFRFHGTRRAF